MVRVAPEIELWARRSRTLRRCRLADDDDARAVLVEVLRRMSAHDHEALRAFIEQRPPTAADQLDLDEAHVLDRLTRLLGEDAGDVAGEPELRGHGDTPLRGWLLRVTDFASKDHVRARLGRGPTPKRATATDAEPLDGATEPAERPPITDLVTWRKVLEEIRTVIETFPPPMQRALALWTEDARFDAIATELALDGPDRARDLVRAATARLRERFRDRFPALAGA